MTKITDERLIYLSKLLKQKMNTLGNSERDSSEKHNIKVIRKFIDMIRDGRIDAFIDKTEKYIRRKENE